MPPKPHHRRSHDVEESFIALLLGSMTLVTFANVVARYVFNSNILWALETTTYLFAWLVLIGISYCVRINAHLGVDFFVQKLAPGPRRILGLVAATCCLIFAVIVFIGAWRYWLPFATTRVWYETNDITMPDLLQFLAPWINEGENWEKLPRFIPYFALPLGFALLIWRFIQAFCAIANGTRDRVIHDYENELDNDQTEQTESRTIPSWK